MPPQVERLRGDRDQGRAGLAALAGRAWDACVDVSGYTAQQVRASAELLAVQVGHYIFISAVSVYGDPRERPVRETQPRQPPAAEHIIEVNQETYGALKVTSEDIVEEVYGGRCALLRPQIVAGPHDPSGRYTYWVRRAGMPGPTLAPGDGDDHLQVIDVRDLARFTRRVVERGLSGPFNLSGPRLTWVAFLRLLGAEDLVWASVEVLHAVGVTERELPLFRPEDGPRAGLMDVSSERAVAAGLTLTPPETTAADTRSWAAAERPPLLLSPEREAELIRLARER